MSASTGKPGRGRPRKFDRKAVADSAMQAYWQEGPTEVSLNAICQQAGVSKPSAYREFGNDDGLAHAALQLYAETVLSQLLAITDSDAPLFGKLQRIVHLSCEDDLHRNGCLFVKMRAARDQMGPRTQALIDEIEGLALGALTQVIEDAQDAGEWPHTISVDLGAAYLHAQIGLALDQRARGLDPTSVLELALSALRPPP